MIESPDELELPRAVALAWGVAANPQRGPKRELSIERIVETAIELADDGGLAAVSMSAVAGALGFTPMSLYRYITAKDDLIALMQEVATGSAPESIVEAEGRRATLAEWASQSLELYRRHPWLLDVPVESFPVTPNSLSWLDAVLDGFSGSDVDPGIQLDIVLALTALSRWEATIQRGYSVAAAKGAGTPDDVNSRGAAILAEFVTPEQFPSLAPIIASGAFTGADNPGGDPDAGFRLGLHLLLDGIDAYLTIPAADRRTSEFTAAPADLVPQEVLADRHVREAAKVRREAEKQLREMRKRERQAISAARERIARQK